MKATELIEKLAREIKENGDCEVYLWNQHSLEHNHAVTVRFIKMNTFNEQIDDPKYIEDFKRICNNIVIN